jgi:membrane protease YdiL (CAAX protease family)
MPKPNKISKNVSQKTLDQEQAGNLRSVPWNGWVGAVYVVLAFLVAQVLGSVIIGVYAGIHHWSGAYAENWITGSVSGQFAYILIAEGAAVGAIYLFMKHYRFSFKMLGVNKPKLKYLGYALVAVPIYYGLAIVALIISRIFAPGINVNETQQIGFSTTHGAIELILTFISLVVLPPLAEEIMVRGFLYGSLKKVVPKYGAVIITSIIFAAAHLDEGSSGLLWTAAIQFFVLSLVLIYLREKTQSLWASIIVHAANNAVAFASLFLIR